MVFLVERETPFEEGDTFLPLSSDPRRRYFLNFPHCPEGSSYGNQVYMSSVRNNPFDGITTSTSNALIPLTCLGIPSAVCLGSGKISSSTVSKRAGEFRTFRYDLRNFNCLLREPSLLCIVNTLSEFYN